MPLCFVRHNYLILEWYANFETNLFESWIFFYLIQECNIPLRHLFDSKNLTLLWALLNCFQFLHSKPKYLVRSNSFPWLTPQCSFRWALDKSLSNDHSPSCHAPRASPKWPVPQAGHLGLTQVSPWNDVKAIRMYRGQTGVDHGKLIKRINKLSIY